MKLIGLNAADSEQLALIKFLNGKILFATNSQ